MSLAYLSIDILTKTKPSTDLEAPTRGIMSISQKYNDNDLRGSDREVNHLTFSSIDRLYDIANENAYDGIRKCLPAKRYRI